MPEPKNNPDELPVVYGPAPSDRENIDIEEETPAE
jgi:hypothetical protein